MVAFTLLASLTLAVGALEMKRVSAIEDLHTEIAGYEADRNDLSQLYPIDASAARRARLAELYRHWQSELSALKFTDLAPSAKADDVLFENHLKRSARQLDLDAVEDSKVRHFVPFAQTVIDL